MTVLRPLSGLFLIILPVVVAMMLNRRYVVPYALLSVGSLVFIGSFLVQILVLGIVPAPFLTSPLIGASLIGLVVGLTTATAYFICYQYLAPAVNTRAQAAMIGAGYASLSLVFVGFSLLFIGLGQWQAGELDSAGDILAQTVINMAPLPFYIALSWVSLQTFLRGTVGWLFGVMLGAGMVAGTERFLQTASYYPVTAVAIWWSIVSVVAVLVLRFLHPPHISDAEI